MKELIIKVTGEEGNKILETREPKGLFYIKHEENGKIRYIGINNSTGEILKDSFKKLKTCKAWLRE